MSRACCFTGHRIISNAEKARLNACLFDELNLLYRCGYRIFHTGGALGFDTLAAQAVLRLRETHSDVLLYLILPCPNQDTRWNTTNRQIYRNILLQADRHEFISSVYSRTALFQRNQALIDRSECCLCYLRNTASGTFRTVQYAVQKGILYKNLYEDDSLNPSLFSLNVSEPKNERSKPMKPVKPSHETSSTKPAAYRTLWLSGNENFTDALAVRSEVFCTEQGFSYDLDDTDPLALHIVMYDGHTPVAAGRIYESDTDTMSLGRIAVRRDYRGKGLGYRLVEDMLKKITKLGYHRAELDAQIQAIGFYERLGFVVCGEPHMDGHVLHREMERFL